MRLQKFEDFLKYVRARRNADKVEMCVELGKKDCPIDTRYLSDEYSTLWTVCLDICIEEDNINFECKTPIQTCIDFYWDKSLSSKVGFDVGIYIINLMDPNDSREAKKAIVGNQLLFSLTAIKDLSVNEYRKMIMENKEQRSKVFAIFTSREEAEDFIRENIENMIKSNDVKSEIYMKIKNLKKILYAIENDKISEYENNEIDDVEIEEAPKIETTTIDIDNANILKSLSLMKTISISLPLIGKIGYISNMKALRKLLDGEFIRRVYKEIDKSLFDDDKARICRFNRIGRLYRLKMSEVENERD